MPGRLNPKKIASAVARDEDSEDESFANAAAAVGAPLSFKQLAPSMIMFVSTYSGKINIKALFEELEIDPIYNGVYKDMPVGPDGTIVAKGFDTERRGAIRITRSKKCFRNCVCVDISVSGTNISFKISATEHLQGAGAKSPEQAAYATQLLVEKLNKLPCLVTTPLQHVKTRIERAIYNFKLGFELNLAEVAPRLDQYDGLSVAYDNAIDLPLRAGKLARRWEEIAGERSSRSKRSKEPSHLFLIRKSGKIMMGGCDMEELGEIYDSFMHWVETNKTAIRLVHWNIIKNENKLTQKET